MSKKNFKAADVQRLAANNETTEKGTIHAGIPMKVIQSSR